MLHNLLVAAISDCFALFINMSADLVLSGAPRSVARLVLADPDENEEVSVYKYWEGTLSIGGSTIEAS